MPYAVTHILLPILLVAIFRDFYLKKRNKKHFPLHYVLIAGLGGVLPDIDLIFSLFLKIIGSANWYVHKAFTHSSFFPAIFFLLFLIFIPIHKRTQICHFGRHKLKLSIIFLMLGIGSLTHLGLDFISADAVPFFYPFSNVEYGIDLLDYLPAGLQNLAFPLLDGILLVIWIAYMELKHKISDFI